MQFRTLVAVAILGFSLTAIADFRTIVEVHEVNLVNLRLPVSASGTLAFSGCADCEETVLRVNPVSQYIWNGRVVNLASFRKAVASVRNRADVTVDVYHHLETNTATRLRVSL